MLHCAQSWVADGAFMVHSRNSSTACAQPIAPSARRLNDLVPDDDRERWPESESHKILSLDKDFTQHVFVALYRSLA